MGGGSLRGRRGNHIEIGPLFSFCFLLDSFLAANHQCPLKNRAPNQATVLDSIFITARARARVVNV